MLVNRERAEEIMERENLDALIAVTPNNVYYLSDYESDFLYDVQWLACAILPRSRSGIEPCLITTEIEAAVLHEQPTWMPDLRLYYFSIYGGTMPVHTFATDHPLEGQDEAIQRMVAPLKEKKTAGMMSALAEALQEKGLTNARLGFDDVRVAGLLGDVTAGADIVDASNTLIEIRMVKTPLEIEILREAARKNETAMRAAISAIHEGATWEEVSRAYEVSVVEQGARIFASFNGAGRRSAGSARVDRDYTINRGDQICFDSMLKWRRYMGDAQRTVSLGEPSAKLQRYWNAFSAGIEEAYSQIRCGISTGELREIAVESIRRNGIPDFNLAFTHGIGLDHIEVPFIAGGTLGDFQVEKNMVLNMDMEVHEVGWGGVFFEESMLVTDDGAERLYTLDRDLLRAGTV